MQASSSAPLASAAAAPQAHIRISCGTGRHRVTLDAARCRVQAAVQRHRCSCDVQQAAAGMHYRMTDGGSWVSVHVLGGARQQEVSSSVPGPLTDVSQHHAVPTASANSLQTQQTTAWWAACRSQLARPAGSLHTAHAAPIPGGARRSRHVLELAALHPSFPPCVSNTTPWISNCQSGACPTAAQQLQKCKPMYI
jgi:hypothetical protein